MLIPLTLYIVERGARLFGKSASITKIVEHPNDVLEIEFFNKSIAAEPGQVRSTIDDIKCHVPANRHTHWLQFKIIGILS